MTIAHTKAQIMWQYYQYSDVQGNHSYFVYAPKTCQITTPIPLLIMLHGCRQTAADFATGTAMNLLAEQHGFVVLYPQQAIVSNSNRCWNWFLPAHQRRGRGEPARIVGMIQNMRQQRATRWTIDPARIYVAGFSAGASMAIILGATYPDLFAAIGVHSGLEYQAAKSVMSAFQAMLRGGPDPQQQGRTAYRAMGDFSRVVPTIVFHGTKDTTISPTNGDQVAQQWLQTNSLASSHAVAIDFHYSTSATTGQVSSGYSYIVTTWKTSNGNELQAYWKIGTMGHAWSGGNPAGSYTDPRGPSASIAMYDFFMAHPMESEDRRKIINQKIRQQHHARDATFFLRVQRRTGEQQSG
ncbi:MAG TPA: PHB depolymerase family esterase [Ktedonobacteraceae bacterium]|nr:PHB depolymerase family esterase [Ktedonobacteraceae bacterium]